MGFRTSSFPLCPPSFRNIPPGPFVAFAKKKNSESESVLSPSVIDDVFMDDGVEDDIFLDGIFFFFCLDINNISAAIFIFGEFVSLYITMCYSVIINGGLGETNFKFYVKDKD